MKQLSCLLFYVFYVFYHKNTLLMSIMNVVKLTQFDRQVTILLILCFLLVEYAEGHHDLPLVTLFAVTELDLCRHDPEGISIDIDININIIAFDYWVYFDKMNVVLPVYIDNNVDYFICYIIWIR